MLLAAMTRDEVRRTIHYEGNGTAAEQLLNELIGTKRATQLRVGEKRFWVCAERLPMLQTIYPQAVFDPQIIAPETAQKQPWERSNAIRELLRGRMEVSGPMMVADLENILGLPRSEIDAGLLGLESEGFVLRGKCHPNATKQEWCDRRLLARIHRLTIDRTRARLRRCGRVRSRSINVKASKIGSASPLQDLQRSRREPSDMDGKAREGLRAGTRANQLNFRRRRKGCVTRSPSGAHYSLRN